MAEAAYPYTFLLDTCVIAKWLKPDLPDPDKAKELVERSLRGEFPIAVADVSLVELAEILRKRHRFPAEEIRRAVALTAGVCRFMVRPFRPTYLRAGIELASKHGLRVYDAYLAGVARCEGYILVTVDQELFDALREREDPEDPFVQWLADWQLPKGVTAPQLGLNPERIASCPLCRTEEMTSDEQMGLCEGCYEMMLRDPEFLRGERDDEKGFQQRETAEQEEADNRLMTTMVLRSRAELAAFRQGWILGQLRASAEAERQWRDLGSNGE